MNVKTLQRMIIKLRQDRDYEHDYSGYGTEYHDRIEAAIADLQRAIDVIETKRLVKVDGQGKSTDEGQMIPRYVDRWKVRREQRHYAEFEKASQPIEGESVEDQNERVDGHLDTLTGKLHDTQEEAADFESMLENAAQTGRDHRRQMNSNIIKAVRSAYGWSKDGAAEGGAPSGDTSKGQTKSLREMLEDTEYFESHYTRVHRQRKGDAAILLWNMMGRSPGQAEVLDGNEALYVRQKAAQGAVDPEKGPATAPADKARKSLLDGVYVKGTSASDFISRLQVMRKNLIVLYMVMIRKSIATNNQIQESWTYKDLESVLTQEFYTAVMQTAVEQKNVNQGILHFNTKFAALDVPVDGEEARHVQDYLVERIALPDSGDESTPDPPIYIFCDRNGEKCSSLPPGEVYAFESGSSDKSHLGVRHFLKHPKNGRKKCLEQLERLVKQRLGKSAKARKWKSSALDTELWSTLQVSLEQAIAESRAIIFDLHWTKYNKDNPNRFINAIANMGKNESIVAKGLADWERRRSLCRVLYERLQEPIPEGSGDTGGDYVRAIVNTIGAVATSRLFRIEDKNLLMQRLEHVVSKSTRPFVLGDYRSVGEEDHTDEVIQLYLADRDLGIEGSTKLRTLRTTWHRWIMYRGNWMRFGEIDLGAFWAAILDVETCTLADEWLEEFNTTLSGVPLTGMIELRDLLVQILELELMELATLVQIAEGDVQARREVDWIHYSREVLDTVQKAKGMIVYVDDLSKAYKTIHFLVKRIFGNLNAHGYSRVGDTAIGLVVALNAGGDEKFGGVASVKCSASIGIQIAGKLSQADDRRVRFSGSFGLNLSAGVGVSASLDDQLDGMSTQGGGDPDSSTTYKHAWIAGKAEAAVDKGLLSGAATLVYVDDRHLAASWAHKLTMLYLHFTQPFRAIRHIPDKANRIKVVNPRTMDPLEDDLLKHMVGDDYQKVLEYVQKDVTTAKFIWQGITNWDDISIKADVSANVAGLGGKFHAERMVHKQTNTYFTKDCYSVRQEKKGDKTYNAASRTPGARWVNKEAIGAQAGKKSKKSSHPVVMDIWSKSYPPTTSLSFSASAVSTAENTTDSNIFDTLTGKDSDPTNTTQWEIGANFDTAPTIDVGFTNIQDHPNWDNDGWYLNIKATRSMGGSYSGPVDVGVSATVTRPINKQKIHNEFDKLRDLADRMLEDLGKEVNSLEDAMEVKEYLMAASGNALTKHLKASRLFRWIHTRGYYKPIFWLCTYGTFELNFVYTNSCDGPRFALQYGRITRGWSTELGGSVPILPGLSVGITGSYNRNWAACEILGHDTLTYVKTVWDGFALRYPAPHSQEPEDDWYKKNKYWEVYKETHANDLLELLARIGAEVGSGDQWVDTNARAEVKDDEGGSNAPLASAAKALREGCEAQFKKLCDFKEPEGPSTIEVLNERALAVSRGNANRARTTEPTAACAVAVLNVDRGKTSQHWPDSDGKLPAKDSRASKRALLVNLKDHHDLVIALKNSDGIQTAVVELVDVKGTVHWSLDVIKGGERQEVFAKKEVAAEPEAPGSDEATEVQDGGTEEASDGGQEVVTVQNDAELPDLEEVITEEDTEKHVQFVVDFKKTLSEKMGAELAQIAFPKALKGKLGDPSKGPFKFQLEIKENKEGFACSASRSMSFIQVVDPQLITKLETYLEAARKAAPGGQAARWEVRDAGDERLPFVVITDTDEAVITQAEPSRTAVVLAQDVAPGLDAVAAENAEDPPQEGAPPAEEESPAVREAKRVWREEMRPAYVGEYTETDAILGDLYPAEISIGQSQLFDGYGTIGLVQITEGALAQPEAFWRFAICHEAGHATAAYKISKVGKVVPEFDDDMSNFLQHEYIADLIAADMIRKKPTLAPNLMEQRNELKLALGGGDAAHPSGTQRIAKILRVLNNTSTLDEMIKDVIDHPPHGNLN